MYDIIGDIHGHAAELEALLTRLGYYYRGGAWRFPRNERRVLFVGDYVDRGPEIPATVELVRDMVAADSAWAVAGNHEYNAVAWHTPDGHDGWLRSHNPVHRRQHEATLVQYATSPGDLRSALDWFRGLPLYWQNQHLRVVHAAWDDELVAELNGNATPLRDDIFLHRSAYAGNRESQIVEVLLKGVETQLPAGAVYYDKEGTPRRKTRTRWWLTEAERTSMVDHRQSITLGNIAMPPADRELAQVTVPAEHVQHLPGYRDSRPIFFGHYWLSGPVAPLSDRVACLDYSVARGGALCAYRFDGTLPLTADRFVCVSSNRRRGNRPPNRKLYRPRAPGQ